jgi:anionic cell wall polymer biosynthesis LytR-Cps2A-Psr (LCP) family protein
MNKLTFPHYVMIAVVLLVSLSLYFSWTSPLATAIRKGERINGIVLGTDWVDRARHSDTLMFVSYDPARRFLDVISIPRDTHFTPLGYNFRKINEVYAYHYRTKRNDDLACHEVQFAIEQLLTNRVNIHITCRWITAASVKLSI